MALAVCLLVALVGVICVAAILGGDWRGASLAAYNKSTVDVLQGLVGSHSTTTHWRSLATIGRTWVERGMRLGHSSSPSCSRRASTTPISCST